MLKRNENSNARWRQRTDKEVKEQQLAVSYTFEAERVELSKGSDLRKNVNFVPVFNETDNDGVFRTSETTEEHLKWPEIGWDFFTN